METTNRMSSRLSLTLCCTLTLASACASPPSSTQAARPHGPRAPGAGLLFQKAELENPRGDIWEEFVVKDGVVNLYDSRGTKLSSYRIAKDRITITTDDSKGSIVRGQDEFTLTDANAKPTGLLLSREPDGDLRIDRDGERLFDLKIRDYGYKIVDARGVELGRVRAGAGSIKVRDHARTLILETKAPLSPAAVACWILPLQEAGALTLAITAWGLPD
jgi:hypothetical protein